MNTRMYVMLLCGSLLSGYSLPAGAQDSDGKSPPRAIEERYAQLVVAQKAQTKKMLPAPEDPNITADEEVLPDVAPEVEEPASVAPAVKSKPTVRAAVPVKTAKKVTPPAKPDNSSSADGKVVVIDPVPSGYYIQITAKPEKGEADFRAETLKSFGYNARIQAVIVSGTKYHRVLVGPFAKRADAEAKASEASTAIASDEVPFIQRF